MMPADAVLKIGGSLSRGEGLAELCREISLLSRRFRLLVVPGGGDFADAVRRAYRKYSLNETSAHFMAVLAMDQYGYLLNELIPGSTLVKDPVLPFQAFSPGSVSVLLPSETILRADPLPHSWDVTSDAIAAWIAQQAGCRRLILLKDVDGIHEENDANMSSINIIFKMTIAQLAAHRGGVDPYLCHVLASAPIDTWIISGLHPERLTELLEIRKTIGTQITA